MCIIFCLTALQNYSGMNMDLPSALLLFNDDFVFSQTLFFCQQHCIDVTDTDLHGYQCLAIYDPIIVPFVMNYIYHHHGTIPPVYKYF